MKYLLYKRNTYKDIRNTYSNLRSRGRVILMLQKNVMYSLLLKYIKNIVRNKHTLKNSNFMDIIKILLISPIRVSYTQTSKGQVSVPHYPSLYGKRIILITARYAQLESD